MGIIDIILIALVVLALGLGLYKGMAGVLLGFIGTLIIAVGVGVAIFFLGPTLMYTDTTVGVDPNADDLGYTSIFQIVYNPISDALKGMDNELMQATLVKNNDQLELFGEFGEDGEKVIVPFSKQVMSLLPFGNNEDGLPALDSLVTKYGAEGLTLAEAFAALTAYFVLGIALWLILFIALVIVKIIIRKFVFKYLDSHKLQSRIDRTLGAVLTVALVIIVAWSLVSFLGMNAESFGIEERFNAIVESNAILNVFNTNRLFGGAPNDSVVEETIEVWQAWKQTPFKY